jgi:WD40 repeat protein
MWNGTVQRWDLTTGDVQTFVGPTVANLSCYVEQINQDGTTALTSFDNTTLLVWDVETGEILQQLVGHSKPLYSFTPMTTQIFPDKTRAVSSIGTELRVWDLKTGECIQVFNQATLFPGRLNETHILHIEITPDMKHAILDCENGELALIDLEKGLVQKVFPAHTKRNSCIQITADGTRAVSGSGDDVWNTQAEIKLWNFCTLPEERLTRIANQCLSNPAAATQQLTELPRFAQHEMNALQANLSFEESIQTYTAHTALPTIRGFLAQALREPNLASPLVSEAFARINNLPPAIRDRVWANFAAIYPGDLQLINKAQIEAGIEAINQTLTEFEAQIPTTRVRARQEGKED